MIYNGKIDLALGSKVTSKTWQNRQAMWSEMVERLNQNVQTSETFAQYEKLSKDERSNIKDVGGYVGAFLQGSRRKPENVMHRQLITLDVDFGYLGLFNDIVAEFNNAMVLHITHSHSDQSPRYRLIMPLDRPVSGEEYMAITRKVAECVDMNLFDSTTFQVHRLMFWPSTSKDTPYYCEAHDAPWLSADYVLGMYADWRDSSQWPVTSAETKVVRTDIDKQEDPQDKDGLIGGFCRTYSIDDAIATYLSDIYTESAQEDRYTYVHGSTSNGLMVYDNMFAYSHHGTDPVSGKLCNAFDLVRIHKFGLHDTGSRATNPVKLPSFKAMVEFVKEDGRVKRTLGAERLERAKQDFANNPVPQPAVAVPQPVADPLAEMLRLSQLDAGQPVMLTAQADPQLLQQTPAPPEVEAAPDTLWMERLSVDKTGKYLSSSNNLNHIFNNDPALSGAFKFSELHRKIMVSRSLPWRKVKGVVGIEDVDLAATRNYLECFYDIAAPAKVKDALIVYANKHRYHPVRDYLTKLKWDGVPRVDTMFVDTLGALDTEYTRNVARKMLVGAVARVMRPGVKFDLMPMLIGKQGCGKSTLVSKLGRQWFSDTFITVKGKEALEQIQGAWIIEIAELAGMRKAEVESVKHFISKQMDMFRKAFGEVMEEYPRQCIFVGTSNDDTPLRDSTGNRRFLPVLASQQAPTVDVWADSFCGVVDQLWAEAFCMFSQGEAVHLDHNLTAQASVVQEDFNETDVRSGVVEDYLNMLVPDDWEQRSIPARQMYVETGDRSTGVKRKNYACVLEIWCECFGGVREKITRKDAYELNEILRRLRHWQYNKQTRRVPNYGVQRGYDRVGTFKEY